MMIECVEVVGKTVRRLRLSSCGSGSQELHLEFTDGTSFSSTVEPTSTRRSRLIRESDQGEHILLTYED